MIIDVSRGEIQLDDLFNAIENDKDQVSQALDAYGDYLKLKSNEQSTNEEKIEILEKILKFECLEKAIVNRNHQKERTRMDLKWTILTECAFAYKKLGQFRKALKYFTESLTINSRVSTIHYEMGLCHVELGHIYEVKQCFEKTIEISGEHLHWKCLENLISFYFLLGNFSKCLKSIRIGYERASIRRPSIYEFGSRFLTLIIKRQPSMKMLIDQMNFEILDDDFSVEQIEKNLDDLKKKLFSKKIDETPKSSKEFFGIENFQDFGQFLLKKIRDPTKLFELIDVEQFASRPTVVVPEVIEETVPTAPVALPTTTNRKKRSFLPLNIDDYEKRRSARSITRLLADDNNTSTVEKIRRLISDEDDSSEEENDIVSPENNDEETIRKENFPSLQIDFSEFLNKISTKTGEGFRFHFLDLIHFYLNELIEHCSTLWPAEIRTIFSKLFECWVEHVQYATTDIPNDHLRSCLSYVELAIGSSRFELSDDSIERFSCFARLKVKYKLLGYSFARLQFYLYHSSTANVEIDSIFHRVLWISSLYYFLSDVPNDALSCLVQLRRTFPSTDDFAIVLPNLFRHTNICKNSIENLHERLKKRDEVSSNSAQELSCILSRLAVAEENDELTSLIKRLDKQIKVFSIKNSLPKKSVVKSFETLINVFEEKENETTRKSFDDILIKLVKILLRMFDEENDWKDIPLKILEKNTLTLIDSIVKRDVEGKRWLFDSVDPWILLFRVTMKRDAEKSEQFLVSFVRTIHEFFGRQENCLVEKGKLLEFFLLELIQLEHNDIRERLASKTPIETSSNDESDEQKSRLTKVIDEIEQCIYCLYGLVLRKSKMKNLTDHHCESLEFTLDKTSLVFYALRPKTLPGYEGRLSVITNETESLFQRFESMIEWNDEREQRRKRLCDLISDATSINSQGKQIDELIHLSEKPFQSNNTLFEKDLYYLFADYYLKMPSKDASSNDTAKKKAQEYYLKDLCLNTRRFDSWAGLTVIEFAKIEEFIIADDFDSRIFQVHMTASCFFRQAVSVETNNLTLWMEYAELTYILQSYCSKYKEKSAEYVPDRLFLLNICKEAYEKANLCTDNDENKEDWIYLYMMAKIEEKLHRNRLMSSLKKYVTALDLLHENKAVYPKKIGHQTSTSNSKGVLLGCHAVEMFYRIHASTLKFLNRHPKESPNFTIDQLKNLHEFLVEMQQKPFATSFYEKTTISADGRSSDQIRQIYFPTRSISDDQWLKLYDQCIWLTIEGLYICVARYNRHYRGLFRLAHFFHTNEFFRNQRLSLDIFLGGQIFELKNYPKIIGLFQERSKHNLFNGIWRIQPLEAERIGSFNSSMFKCTKLFIDLLLQFDEQLNLLIEVLRQLLEKPSDDKKYVREVERKLLCHHAVRNLFRSLKKKVTAKTREDIEREGLNLLSTIDLNDTSNIPLPFFFELSIRFYNLLKNFTEFFVTSRLNELVELTFQRYRSILKFSNHLPENPKAENLIQIYTPKKVKSKKRPSMVEPPTMVKRPCVEVTTTSQEFLGLASFLSND